MNRSKVLERREIPEALTWNLNMLYASDAEWERDFKALDALVAAANAFRGRLAESAQTLFDAIKALDALERKLDKLYTFAHLRHDENTAEAAARSREARARAKASEITAACAWFDPEIMAVPDAAMQTLLAAPELKFYKPSLEELLRAKPHTLGESEERLLGMLSDVLSSSGEIYETLTDSDMRFPVVRNASGKKVELTHGNYRVFQESRERKVRKKSFEAMFESYARIANTCAATLDGTVREHVKSARIRHHGSALAAALFDDELPESLYTNLIEAVHHNIPALTAYLKLRRKTLKLKKLDMYDLFNPLVDVPVRRFTYEEAQQLVLAAFEVMGGEYVDTVKRAFKERWVDVMECRGKRSGAYSSGCYDSVPYLLLNFNGTLNDVFTLAHELGHSMHSYFSNRAQDFHYANYSIFAAEIASTTNELLLHEYLMKHSADDRNLQVSLLAHLADEIRATVYRQTMFAEFELEIHRSVEKDAPLTAELLNDRYYRLNDLYYGGEIQADKLIQYEWARIPHFYYDFYVFKYATGMSAAMKFAQNLRSGDAALRDRYFGFLKAGDSRPVLDILRDAGVDFSSPRVISEGLSDFATVVKELKKRL